MAHIILPSRRLIQPSGAVQLRPEFGRAVVFLFNGHQGGAQYVTTSGALRHTAPKTGSSATSLVGAPGSFGWKGTSAAATGFDLADVKSYLQPDRYVSVLAVTTPLVNSDEQNLFQAQDRYYGGYGYALIQRPTSGDIRWRTADQVWYYDLDAAGFMSGVRTAVMGTFRLPSGNPGTMDKALYQDGVRVASEQASRYPLPYPSVRSDPALLCGRSNSGAIAGYGYAGAAQLVAVFPYDLPESAAQSLTLDPYQIFQPQKRRLYFFAAAGGGDQNITATAIATAEAFGTARIDFDVLASAIATAEAFGTARIDFDVLASAIATAEAFGTARLDLDITASGIATAEAFGTAQLNLEIILAGVASGEAFGSHAVNLDTEQSITAAGNVASLEAFGTARLDFDLLAAAIASAEAFGTAQLDLNITATGIATGEAHGATTVELDTTQNVTPTGVASLEGFGIAQLDFALLMTAASSGEAFGSHTITGGASTFILTGRTFRDEGGRVFRAPPKGRTIH